MSNNMSRPRPVLIVMSVVAGLQVLVAGGAFADVLGVQTTGFAILVVAAIQAGMAFYLQGQVTPVSDPHDKNGVSLISSH